MPNPAQPSLPSRCHKHSKWYCCQYPIDCFQFLASPRLASPFRSLPDRSEPVRALAFPAEPFRAEHSKDNSLNCLSTVASSTPRRTNPDHAIASPSPPNTRRVTQRITYRLLTAPCLARASQSSHRPAVQYSKDDCCQSPIDCCQFHARPHQSRPVRTAPCLAVPYRFDPAMPVSKPVRLVSIVTGILHGCNRSVKINAICREDHEIRKPD